MFAFPTNGWETERVNWDNFLRQFETELFEPIFKHRGYTKNAALQAYFINVATTMMIGCDCDEGGPKSEEGDEWKTS